MPRDSVGVSLLGLHNLHKADIFNEYTIGRSSKCDLTVSRPSTTKNEAPNENPNTLIEQANTAYGLVSNLHCRIYCALSDPKTEAASGPIGMAVYIEDCSGNGTVINKTTLLNRGEKRLLHSGDEISLISSQILQKKVRSTQAVNDLVQYYSFIFVNCSITNCNFQQQLTRGCGTLPSAILSRMASTPYSVTKRKAAVNVRSTNHPRTNCHLYSNCTDDNKKLSFPLPARRSPRQHKPNNITQGEQCKSQSSPSRNMESVQRACKVRRIQEDYDIRDMLGSGTVGNVHRAIHRITGKEFAVKIIQLARNRQSNFFQGAINSGFRKNHSGFGQCEELPEQFEAEALILRGLEHPYIVQLIDVYVSPGVAVYIVIELVQGGDLFDRIVEKGRYNEVDSRRVMRRLLSALHYLHEEQNIVHRYVPLPSHCCCSTLLLLIFLSPFFFAI